MKRIISLLAVLAFAAPAVAQDPSAERLAAAGELVDAMDVEETMQETVELTMSGQLEQLPHVAGMEDIIRKYVERALEWGEIRDDVVRLYAEIFTASEMQQLEAFYRSPIGRRMIETTPELSAGIQAITNRRMQALMPEMMQEMMGRMGPAGSTGGPG